MGIEHRPYVGTWQLNNRKLVQHTPDALVFINGDTALPGCAKCGGRIDIQRFITQVSVDAGVDPASASAQVSLAVPLHSKDQFHRDAQFLLRPGLEVHVYFRGYFAVRGLYKNITPEEMGGTDVSRLPAYPYFHVFHGVVTQVDHSYSGGFQEISLNCASMLHFWQYHNMSTNASIFGARPTNSGLRTTFVGHVFNGFTPFSIIYTLFHDTAGAAGGVAFALSNKSNVNAKSTLLGESLFSSNIRYWEQRFSTRMINLRMHGMSGQVFSTAQAAFLGRLSGDEVNTILRDQWKVKGGKTKKFDILSAAQTLNLVRVVKDPVTGEERVTGLDVTAAELSRPSASPKSGNVRGTEINIAAMQAFVQDINQMGPVNLWESTYESKLDMVNKVREITGWEFYQDVDGDFVFKPPMYNLDTRSNRVYVIKDIDIISLNHTEKEPEATYVTMTGSQFKNLKGTGVENEWGVRGQFIDYKLVAQFGWRPGSFETSYFSDERSMFFAAVNRLAVMNVGVHAASLTIPQRPEMRPGYPIYIESLDVFYYVQSMNHSMVWGGQCTSSLSLVGKRAKFYPPGIPGKIGSFGVDNVDLANTALPQTPLEVLSPGGHPTLSGMPNVVMALDPENTNPLFFLAGTDLEDISNPQVVKNIISLAKSYGIISEEPSGSGNFVFFIDNAQSASVRVSEDSSEFDGNTATRLPDSDGRVRRTFTFESLFAASASYAAITSQTGGRLEEVEELVGQKSQLIKDKQFRIGELEEQRQEVLDNDGTVPEAVEAEIANLTREVSELQKTISDLTQDFTRTEQNIIQRSLQSDDDIQVLITLVRSIGDSFLSANVDFPDPNSSAALLEVLSDKKAIFSNGTQPGFYRYFSSAHPNPKQQGLDPLEVPREVSQFVFPSKLFPDGTLPDAELGLGPVSNGLRILRPFGEEVMSTEQIQTISFQESKDLTRRKLTTYEYKHHFDGLDESYRSFLFSKFGVVAKAGTETLEELFSPSWTEATSRWVKADPQRAPPFPVTISYGSLSVPTSTSLDEFGVLADLMGLSLEGLVAVLQPVFTQRLFEDASVELRVLWSKVVGGQTKGAQKAAEKVFRTNLRAAWKKAKFKLARKRKAGKNKEEPIHSPVFPVSDEGGYEVIGNYRYGRGLQIQGSESMEQLAFTDPLQFADPQAVEDFVDVLRGQQPNSLSFVDEDGNRTGSEDTFDPVRTAAERRLVDSILANPGAPDELRELLLNPETQNSVALNNWMARHNEGVLKLSVANTAFTVADLDIFADLRTCDCRAAQADVLIEAFSTERFVSVVEPTADRVTQFAQDVMLQNAVGHGHVQNALRGKQLDRSANQLSQAFKRGVETWDKLPDFGRQSLEQLDNQARALGESVEAVGAAGESIGDIDIGTGG